MSEFVNRPLVYIAGPYTNPDPIENTRRAILVAEEVLAEGAVTPFVPHLSMLWHLVASHDLQFWYDYDLAMLARCDAVLRLPGSSTGADEEVRYAAQIGLPVFHSVDELHTWCIATASERSSNSPR